MQAERLNYISAGAVRKNRPERSPTRQEDEMVLDAMRVLGTDDPQEAMQWLAAWNVTETEYRRALELSRHPDTSPEDSAAYWQLCRYYRGQIFGGDDAARALRMLRKALADDA